MTAELLIILPFFIVKYWIKLSKFSLTQRIKIIVSTININITRKQCAFADIFLRSATVIIMLKYTFGKYIGKIIIDIIEQIEYTNCRSSKSCAVYRSKLWLVKSGYFFFAFTAYNTSMDCISLVCLFTINETTNGVIDIWSIICYIICARQVVTI